MNASREWLEQCSREVIAASGDWLRADREWRALCRRMADLVPADDSAWGEVMASRAARSRCEERLGRSLGRWLAVGGTLTLEDPRPAAAPPPPRVEVAPTEPAAPPAPPAPARPEVRLEAPAVPALPPAGPAAPPPQVSAPPAPASPKARLEDLQELQLRGIGCKAEDRRPAEHLAARDHLARLSDRLQAPLEAAAIPALQDWVRAVDLLDPLPDVELKEALGTLVCRLRALQDREPAAPLEPLFQALTGWSARRRPGFVSGLARGHAPDSGSWDADAERRLRSGGQEAPAPAPAPAPADLFRVERAEVEAWSPEQLRAQVERWLEEGVAPDHTRLMTLLEGRLEDLVGSRALKRVRSSLRDRRAAQAPRNPPRGAPPADWPWFHLTRGKRAVVVGGDPRPECRDRIREAFDFARVEWVEAEARSLDRLAERGKSGSVDVFLLNRFAPHSMDDKLLPALGGDLSRWVRVDHGYGVSEVRRCMEAHWASLRTPEEPGSE